MRRCSGTEPDKGAAERAEVPGGAAGQPGLVDERAAVMENLRSAVAAIRLSPTDVEIDPVDGAHQLFPLPYSFRSARARSTGVSTALLTKHPFSSVHMPRASAGRPGAAARCLQQQRRVRTLRLGHGGALGGAQPAQQLAALGVDDGERVGEPGRRGRDQLEVNSAFSSRVSVT
jgi:hypothetical protein